MLAMQLSADQGLRAIEVSLPRPQDQEVKLRIRRVGICGSDIAMLNGTNPYVRLPVIPGHEFAGEIVEVGLGANRRVGERVTVRPTVGCGQCLHCQRGETNRCAGLQIMGVHRDGAFAEEIIVPASNALPLPEHMTFVQGAMAEPTAVAVHMCNRLGVRAGNRLAIIGTGSIGLLALQVARARGAAHVLAIDQNSARLQLASQLGASQTVSADVVGERLAELAGNGGFDNVIELVGLPQTMGWALQLAASGGNVLLGALPDRQPLPLDSVMAYRKELSVVWTRCFTDHDFVAALQAISGGDVRVEPLAGEAMPLRELTAALQLLKSDPARHVKMMLCP